MPKSTKKSQHKKKPVIVQSLWVGDNLSRMEHYSIKSFLTLGFEYHLYTYNHVKNIPKGYKNLKVFDANKIMPQQEIFDVKKTFLPFSDIWRYKMLYEKGNYWVDLDMIAIKMFDFNEEYLFSSERTLQEGAFASHSKKVANIGVLKAPKGSLFYKEAYEKCSKYNKRNKNEDKLKYMKMLKELIKKHNMQKYVKEPKLFCNLDWWHAKEAFEKYDRFPTKYGVVAPPIKSNFKGPYTVHFWRDKVKNVNGYDLDAEYDKDCLWEQMLTMIDNRKNTYKKKQRKSKKLRR
jgi:hypothetical protein